MASLGELFIELAFEGDTSKAEEFKKKIVEVTKAENKQQISFKQAKGAIFGFVGAITGAVLAVQKLTDSLISQNQQWMNLTRSSDIALSTYQKWDSVGKMFGVNNAAQQIKNLNDRLFELKLTGANAQGFMLAGINPTNADDVMEQLRSRVSGLSDTSASYLLRQLGLDENMLHILRMSKEEFASLTAEMKKFQLTKEQRQSIQEMNVQIQIASQKLQYLKDRAVLAILPAWVKFLQSLVRVAQGIKIVVSGVVNFIKNSNPLIKGLLGIAAALGVVKLALIALTAHPIIAGISALLAVLYLLIDDVVGYMQGKNSGIGYLINFFKDLGEHINFETPQWIKDLLEIVNNSAIFTRIKNWSGHNGDNPNNGNIFTRVGDKSYEAGVWIGEKLGERQLKQYNNNLTKTSNATINQNNTIYTTEAAKTVQDNLGLLQRNTAYQTV